nr:copia protein [Tanacetum cinerariifolium]
MSSPNYPTSNIKDAFSFNFLDYTTALPGNISPDPSDNLSKYLFASLAISPFHNVQVYNDATKPPIPPQDHITPPTILTPSPVEARLVEFKTQEIKFCEKIKGLDFDVKNKNIRIENRMNELEQIKKEKEGLDSKLTGFESASKDLDTLLGRLPEFVDDTITDYSMPSPSIKPMIKFVKAADSPTVIKTNKVETVRKPSVKYAEMYRNTSKSPKDSGCSRHMTGNISYLSDYELYDGGYVSFGQGGGKIISKEPKKISDALKDLSWVEAMQLVEFKNQEIKFCEKIRGLEFKVESKANRIKNLTNELETLKKEKEGLDSKLTSFKSATKDLENLIRSQRSDKIKEGLGLPEFEDYTITNYTRPSPSVESNLNDLQNNSSSISRNEESHSSILSKPEIKFVKPADSLTVVKTDKKETIRKPSVKYAKMYKKTSKRSNVKGRTWAKNNYTHKCRSPITVFNKTSRPPMSTNRPNMNAAQPKRTSFYKPAHSYVNRPFQRKLAGNSQNNVDDKGYWDSGFSRHMTGNISYLSDYEPYDGGYVSFGQGGCKITGKGTIKTDLTYLVAKASVDESTLWHRRLGHLNFKTMNRLAFYDYHNMITILEKSEHNIDFHQIVDFVEASHIRYALTINPTVYVSHIRHFWSTARIETTNEGTKILTTVDDEPASLLRDVSQREAFITVSGLDAGHDRENIIKTSALPHDSTPKVTSLNADEGTQDLEISNLKARIKLLEDKDKRSAELSRDDALIKGRSMEIGEEARVEKNVSVPLVAEVSTVGVLTVSGLVPTVSAIFTTTSVVTPYSRRLREISAKDKAKEIEEKIARDNQMMNEQIARDAEIARIHDEKELKMMIDGLDRNNEVIARHLQEYEESKAELSIREKIELINELVKYQDHHAKILKYQAQQSKPLSKKEQREFYMSVLRSHSGWKTKHFRGMTLDEIREKFITVWKQIEDFVPMSSKEKVERFTGKGLRLEQGSAKRMKTSEDVSEEDIKEMMQLVPVEEVYLEALQVKHPIIDWEIHSEGQGDYWEIIRLGGHIAEEVYVSQPDGFVDQDNPNHVYKLKKALYGLKQAPHVWYDMLSSFLISQDFSKGLVDPTLFIRRNENDLLLVQIYVDDIIFVASTSELDTPMVEKSKLDEDKEGKAIDPSHYRGLAYQKAYTCSKKDLLIPTWNYLSGSMKSAIALCCNNVQHSRSKHIDITYHFIKEQVENGVIELYCINTEYQLADLFTKALGIPTASYRVPTSRRTSHCKRRKMPLLEEKISHCQKDHTAINVKKKLPVKDGSYANKYKTTKELWAAILKTFGGNKATKKTKKNLLKQQYGDFKAEGSKTLELTFNRLQVIVGQLQFMDVDIEQDDLNQKFLTSLAPEWLMHTIVSRNRSDLDTMSLDDLYNHLKVYESKVQKKTKPHSHNMAFISLVKHNSRNEDGNTACVPTANTNVSTAIDEDDMEEMDIKWNMALLSMRADKFWKK